MLTVWKFGIKADRINHIQMPSGAKILTVQPMNISKRYRNEQQPFIWALVDTDKPTVTRKILVVGTGHEIKDTEMPMGFCPSHIGTFQIQDCDAGLLVFHLFDLGE